MQCLHKACWWQMTRCPWLWRLLVRQHLWRFWWLQKSRYSRRAPVKHLLRTWGRFLSLARSKLRLCSANHRAGYFSSACLVSATKMSLPNCQCIFDKVWIINSWLYVRDFPRKSIYSFAFYNFGDIETLQVIKILPQGTQNGSHVSTNHLRNTHTSSAD